MPTLKVPLRLLQNAGDQIIVGAAYLALALGLHIRPDVGTILPYLESTTIFNNYSVAALYFMIGGALIFRPRPIVLWKYVGAIVPMLVTCGYLFIYMLFNVQTSLITGIIALFFDIYIFYNLIRAV